MRLDRPAGGLFVSGLSAGLDVGFSLFLMAVMLTRVEGKLPEAVESICCSPTCTRSGSSS